MRTAGASSCKVGGGGETTSSKVNSGLSPTEFPAILDRFREPLWRLTAGYARQRSDREDLYQDILLAVWRALPTFRGACSQRTFVYRVAHNRGISYRARASRARGPSLDEVAEPEDRRRGPETEAIERDRLAVLRQAVRQLPLGYREPVLLRLEGLPARDIADIMGITTNNVDVRLARARHKLRDAIDAGERR